MVWGTGDDVGGHYYGVLGLDRTATDEQVRAAYRDLAKAFHPDRFASAPDAVRTHANRTMAEINEAYRTLGDPRRRAAYDGEQETDRLRPDDGATEPPPARHEPPPRRPPHEEECFLCGSTPAVPVSLRRQVGLLLVRRSYAIDETLCRDCGLAMQRDWTARTLWTGWWGLISIFANFGALLTNLGAWETLRQLGPPERRDHAVASPLSRPLATGKPLWQRPAVLGFVALVGIMTFSYASEESPSGTGRPTTASVAPATSGSTGGGGSGSLGGTRPRSVVGSCVVVDSRGYLDDLVPCYQPNDGRIVHVVSSSTRCPQYAEWYFEVDANTVLCVDE